VLSHLMFPLNNPNRETEIENEHSHPTENRRKVLA
jgi:hypothetical protein